VESDPAVADQRAVCDQAARDLQHRIKSYIGVTASVIVGDPGTIERSAGKARRVIDTRS
jgi:phenylacetate-CoA ligase